MTKKFFNILFYFFIFSDNKGYFKHKNRKVRLIWVAKWLAKAATSLCRLQQLNKPKIVKYE